MTIKLILLAGLAAAAFLSYRASSSARSLAVRRLAVASLLPLGAVAILFPGIVTSAAQLVGVGRGTDLVLYLFVVVSTLVIIGLHRRLHELERRLVSLNRSVALSQARTELDTVAQSPVGDPSRAE